MAGGCCAYAFEGNRYVPEPRTVNVRALDSWDAIVYEYPTDFEEDLVVNEQLRSDSKKARF